MNVKFQYCVCKFDIEPFHSQFIILCVFAVLFNKTLTFHVRLGLQRSLSVQYVGIHLSGRHCRSDIFCNPSGCRNENCLTNLSGVPEEENITLETKV